MPTSLPPLVFATRLGLAIALGAVIGLERQLRQHEAGLKTNALVAGGSAIFVAMAYTLGEADRTAAQIVTGIGFLGAGIIMRDGLHVRGLNTAATLWCAAAIGALAGAGNAVLSMISAGAVVVANIVLREIAEVIDRRNERAVAEGKAPATKGQ